MALLPHIASVQAPGSGSFERQILVVSGCLSALP